MSLATLYFPKYLSEFKSTKLIDQSAHQSILIVDQAEYPFISKHIINKECSENVLYKSSSKLAPVFLTSGMGGMSGANGLAGLIANVISISCEINFEPLVKRFNQGWLNEIITDLDVLIDRIRTVKQHNIVTSIGFYGNVVDVWERLVDLYNGSGEILVELGSDQTSCHNILSGGYMPVGLSFECGNKLLAENPSEFLSKVKTSLKRQMNAINILSERTNLKFFDYGNAFLLEACKAGADIVLGNRPEKIDETNLTSIKLKYKSYFQLIMDGKFCKDFKIYNNKKLKTCNIFFLNYQKDIFCLGFGPFRWICHSNDAEDLKKSDQIAMSVVEEELNILKEQLKKMNKIPKHLSDRQTQLQNNLTWIKEADKYKLSIGCKARILYCDKQGRTKIAMKFNEAIRNGEFKGPIVLSRDHHDVSSADSPFREASRSIISL